ncbi:oxidoreductase [Rhodovibrionaceae bacterium A322]
MACDPRFELLFEPQAIGPVTAPNRFYQVPHASGMTNAMPRTRAKFREIKAEGGWGVISTGACSMHPSSDDSPLPFARLWCDEDIRSHALMTEAVHRHGALAAIELFHGGAVTMNRTSRLPLLSPSGKAWLPNHVGFMSNVRPKVMDKQDIADLLRWQKEGALRAKSAGFDIVYVYAGMGYLPYQFLLSDYNERRDEYGGSVDNRARLVAQLIEVTKEAVGDSCGVALRVSMEELRGKPHDQAASEAHRLVEVLGDLPDLWDVKMDSGPTDCAPSRFAEEGSHESIIDFVKQVTDKPVVGVGRFTSPDTMVSQIKRGVLDFIGAARPSIADPFLPNKIREGRPDEIRECIGCNICISSWHDGVPVRCTQNPTIGEEWRRDWHPEKVAKKQNDDRVLVVGGGPAGLECARVLALRGHEVVLSEGRAELGGRLVFETTLPGLNAWGRVRDYRLHALRSSDKVSLYTDSLLSADDICDFGFEQVVLATGSRWSKELLSPLELPMAGLPEPEDGSVLPVYTPDDIAAGVTLEGPVVVFDFDGYTMGSVMAEHLALQGHAVTYVTPSGYASNWGVMDNVQPLVHKRFAELGIRLKTLSLVAGLEKGQLRLKDFFSGAESSMPCGALVIVGTRLGNDDLHRSLMADPDRLEAAGIKQLHLIGDALTPGALAHAVHSGHSCARVLGEKDPRRAAQHYKLDGPLGPLAALEVAAD